MQMRISACYIVRNEAANLKRSLESLEGMVDEIVVVDTGSSDDTIKVAEAHGARVFHFPWQDDFSAARNVSLSKATGDWILVVDADEYFSEDMGKNIRPVVERYGMDADLLIFLRRELDQDSGEVLLDTYVSRLLRRVDCLAYEGAIHEEPRHRGEPIARMATIPDDELLMMHTGYSATLLRSKGERNLALLERELASGHPRDTIYMYLSETYDSLQDEEQAVKYAWLDVRKGRKPFIFASRTYCILIRILAKYPERYRERRRATALAVRDFPEIPEFHAEYAECLGYGLDYLGAVRECRTALSVFASGLGCGVEPSIFTQETADYVGKRMEMWAKLAQNEMEEEPLRALAKSGNWRELSKASEQAVRMCGIRLFALLLLTEEDALEETKSAAALAESMLPPDMASLWTAYKGETAVDERMETIYAGILEDVVSLLGITQAARFAAFAKRFSTQGRIASARVMTKAEAWEISLSLLNDITESIGEVERMKGVCLYHLGAGDEARRSLLAAQEASPSTEASSYLRWLEVAGDA